MRAINLPRFGRRAAIVVSVAALASGGGIAYAAVTACPTQNNPSNAQLEQYMKCRLDAIELKVDALAKPPVTTTITPTPSTTTVTVTATPTATTTTTAATSTTTTTPSTTTTTTTTPPPSSGWPDASNTGYTGPLGAYTGPCTIQTAGTIVDSKDVAAACGFLNVRAPSMLIKNSKLPGVEVNGLATASLTIQDSTVDIGQSTWSSVGGYNLTIVRSEILGGQHSVGGEHDVTVADSWLHGQWNDPNASFHNNAFITNGGSNFTLRHNTLHCDPPVNSNGGGCTADVSLFGDFSQVSNVLVEHNLLKANNSSISYCAYGGHSPSKPYPNATGVQYRDNVFERGPNGKCGAYGPVTAFDPNAAGNVWTGNIWEDGAPVPSSD